MRGHEAEVMRLLGEIEALVSEVRFRRHRLPNSHLKFSRHCLANLYPPNSETPISEFHRPGPLAQAFPLPWSAYVRLLSVKNCAGPRVSTKPKPALRLEVRQLDRQSQQPVLRAHCLSRNKAAMLQKAEIAEAADVITPEQASKTLSYWSSSTSRTSTQNPSLKKR
jgi:hypothetical protein